MTPEDNVLYFKNGYDVRLCTKNGMTTLKRVYLLCHYEKDLIDLGRVGAGQIHRMKFILEQTNSVSYPFRKKSTRVAIKRDPVKRFQSAAAYLHRFDEPDLPVTIDDIIRQVEEGVVKDPHFYSQNYFMGKPEDYDIVYHINDLPDLLRVFEKECPPPSSYPEGYISSIKKNVSSYHHNYDLLTQDQEDKIKELYERDYRYGWC